MILLKSLELKNFLSHEDTTIHFNETEKLLLDGKSGAGKSTITEGILFALYGRGRTENKSLIKRGAKLGTVLLKLVDTGTEIIITRTISDKGKNTLTVTQNSGDEGKFTPIETTGIKDTQNWIEKNLLKASFELFANSIVYQQENESSFVKATASKRKDLLLEIVRAGNFDDLYEKTRKFISNVELENAVHSSDITHLEESVGKNKELALNLDLYTQGYEDTSTEIKYLDSKEKSLEEQLRDIANYGDQISRNKRNIKIREDRAIAIGIEIDFNDKQIEEHSKIDPNVFIEDLKEASELVNKVTEIEKEIKSSIDSSNLMYNHMANKPKIFDYTKDISDINKRLLDLKKDTTKCPAGESCPYAVPILGQITYLEEQILDRENKSKKEKEDLEKWETVLSTIPPIKDTTDLHKQVTEAQEKIRVLRLSTDKATQYLLFKDGLGELNVKQISLKIERDECYEEIRKDLEAITKFEKAMSNFDVNKVNIELSNIRISKDKAQKLRDECSVNKQLAINAGEAVKIDSEKIDVKKALLLKGQESIACTNLLKEALSPRGIKAVVIDYIVPQLEERINDVLSQMSDFKIRLDTQAPKADDEGVKEGLFITVKNDQGQEMPYESYSGGEKVKITIAISEALASLMNEIGFRIMDENIVSLDKESTEGFVDVLTKLQNKFPQLLVISHLQEVKDMFEKKITIIKNNGVSKII